MSPVSACEQNDSSRGGLLPWVLAIFVILLIARLLAVYNLYFLEEDEISLATGIAALVRDNVGDLYRYTPQWGYHRLIELGTLALGGDVYFIPVLMKGWSAVVGALVPALGLVMFRDRLSFHERWLLVLVLAANPILWHSSQYGNTAMASLGFIAIAIAVLSNPGGVWRLIVGLGCVGIAIFVRADAILTVPLFAFLVRLQVGSWRRTFLPMAALGAVGLAGATAIWLFDPRLDNAATAVTAHMFGLDNETLFWEYMIWAFSPLMLGFALIGGRSLGDRRMAVLGAVVLGTIVPALFYFRAATTPRYFLLAVIPVSIAIAVGIEDVARLLQRRWSPRVSHACLLAVATLHLFVGLGRFPINSPRAFITDARIPTHDGLVPTGALLYDAYLRGGLFYRSIRNDGFGELQHMHWEPRAFERAIEEVAGRSGGGTVILLFGAGWDHSFHYHAQAAGLTYVSRERSDPSEPFASETWLEAGRTRLMTIRHGGSAYEALPVLDVESGDEVWITGTREFPAERDLDKLPPGLTLYPADSFEERIRIFRVAPKASAGTGDGIADD